MGRAAVMGILILIFFIDFPFKTWLEGEIYNILILQDVLQLLFNPESDTVSVQRGGDGIDTIVVRHSTFTVDGEPFVFRFKRENRAPDDNTVFLTRDPEHSRHQEIGQNDEMQTRD